MSESGYRVDDRSAKEFLRELREVAAAQPVGRVAGATAPTWASLLFDGQELGDLREPSRALLHALVESYPGLLEHLNTLPDRALVAWLERRLGIPRLPVVPDEVVAVATADPKKLPVVIPAGTVLRGGRDAAGNERRYETKETLTVLGTELIDVRSYRVGTGNTESAASWSDPKAPFEPFPADASVPHALDIVTDILRFTGGTLTVRLTFVGATTPLPSGLLWQYSTTDRLLVATVANSTPVSVDLQLVGGCGPLAADGTIGTFVRVTPTAAADPAKIMTFSFTSVTAEVLSRTPVTADAGFFNDGVLDITKEFQPFGPVGKRGDSLYLQSEEAFSKPLRWLTVTLTLLGPDEIELYAVNWGGGIPTYLIKAAQDVKASQNKAQESGGGGKASDPGAFLDRFRDEPDEARVEWQQFDGDQWHEFAHTDDKLTTLIADRISPVGGEFSRPFAVAGVRGHMIRAFLARGDFGWADYQYRIARFAAAAAKTGGTPSAADLIPPDPPVLSRVTVEYKTSAETIGDLRPVNGWSRRPMGSGKRFLFSRPVPPDGVTGTAAEIALGLRLADEALGSTVSLYIDVAPAAACSSSAAVPRVAWEYFASDQTWKPLDTVDGTAGLRQAGLFRFVAPLDWAEGSSELSASEGRWIRALTNLPDRFGVIRAVVPDAVTAAYTSLLDPDRDPTSETPLKPGELKGLLAPIEGIKKVTNPVPGTVGRGPEPDARYVDRSAGWARHRNRAIQAWDYEALVAAEFPEVAAVRCLPHTDEEDSSAPGTVGLVVIPHSSEPMPYPSVTLAERIRQALAGRLPVHARLAILCPIYVGVSVKAKATLRPGVAASDAKRTVADAIDGFLHPGPNAQFGREFFASTLVRFLETRPEIDHIATFALKPETGDRPITVDPCRGLVASSGVHELVLEERL